MTCGAENVAQDWHGLLCWVLLYLCCSLQGAGLVLHQFSQKPLTELGSGRILASNILYPRLWPSCQSAIVVWDESQLALVQIPDLELGFSCSS